MNRSFVTLGTLAILAAAACDKSAQDSREKVEQAQAQATTEITNAQMQASDKVNAAQAKADKKIAEAQGDFDKTREDYRHTMQSNLDTLDKKIADLDAKILTATGAKKGELQTKSQTLHTERDMFANDVKSLPTTTLNTWDAAKARLDKEWSDVKTASDKIIW